MIKKIIQPSYIDNSNSSSDCCIAKTYLFSSEETTFTTFPELPKENITKRAISLCQTSGLDSSGLSSGLSASIAVTTFKRELHNHHPAVLPKICLLLSSFKTLLTYFTIPISREVTRNKKCTFYLYYIGHTTVFLTSSDTALLNMVRMVNHHWWLSTSILLESDCSLLPHRWPIAFISTSFILLTWVLSNVNSW